MRTIWRSTPLAERTDQGLQPDRQPQFRYRLGRCSIHTVMCCIFCHPPFPLSLSLSLTVSPGNCWKLSTRPTVGSSNSSIKSRKKSPPFSSHRLESLGSPPDWQWTTNNLQHRVEDLYPDSRMISQIQATAVSALRAKLEGNQRPSGEPIAAPEKRKPTESE